MSTVELDQILPVLGNKKILSRLSEAQQRSLTDAVLSSLRELELDQDAMKILTKEQYRMVVAFLRRKSAKVSKSVSESCTTRRSYSFNASLHVGGDTQGVNIGNSKVIGHGVYKVGNFSKGDSIQNSNTQRQTNYSSGRITETSDSGMQKLLKDFREIV